MPDRPAVTAGATTPLASIVGRFRKLPGFGVAFLGLSTDLLVAASKFVGAAITHSSAMFAEGVHSLVDISTELVLLYGVISSSRRPNAQHLLGYGRDAYFWNFIAALIILAVGAGASLRDGVRQIISPHPLERAGVACTILAVAFVLDGIAALSAWRHARAACGRQGFWSVVVHSRDATLNTVLVTNVAGMVGVLLAAFGSVLGELWLPAIDGFATVGIAIILAMVALFLAAESRSLILGVPATPRVVRAITATAADDPAVKAVVRVTTVHVGPDQLVVALWLAFREDLHTAQIEQSVAAIEAKLRTRRPRIASLSITPCPLPEGAELPPPDAGDRSQQS